MFAFVSLFLFSFCKALQLADNTRILLSNDTDMATSNTLFRRTAIMFNNAK